MTATALGCATGSRSDNLEFVAPRAIGLIHVAFGYYALSWKSPKNYAGTCKTLHLDIGEGVTRDAYFRFTK